MKNMNDPETMIAQIRNYEVAVRNYEKAIKRLRNGVWSGNRAKLRVRELEALILEQWCGKGIDECVRTCPNGSYRIHSEAAAITRRGNGYVPVRG